MAVAEVGIAVNERVKVNGEYVEKANFFDCTFWSKTAEILTQYCHKGSQVLVSGRLQQDTWEKDGQKRSKVKIVCDRLVLLGTKGAGQQTSEPAAEETQHYAPSEAQPEPADTNSIPF